MAFGEERFPGQRLAANLGFAVLRAVLGVIFIAHGAQKLFGWFGGAGYEATIQQFGTGLGIPPWLTVAVMVVEFFGGLALLLGVFTRTAAFLLALDMLVAGALVHAPNGFFLASPGEPRGNGVEFVLALLGGLLLLLFAGPGEWALAGDTEAALATASQRRARPVTRARVG